MSFFVEDQAYPLVVADEENSIPLTIIPGSIPAMISGLIAKPKMKGRRTTRKTGIIICFRAVMQAGLTVPP